MRGLVRAAALAVAAGGMLAVSALLGAGPAVAAAAGEQISSYDIRVDVTADGSMHVRETIAYDFGSASDRHGIFRTLPVSVPYDSTRERRYPVEDVEVSSPTGAPSDVEQDTSGGVLTLKIGDADQEVSGTETYVISYVVGGTLNDFADHQELYWNLVGTYWEVPIAAVTASVTAPAAATRVACFTGGQGSTQTCATGTSGTTATFTGRDLLARQGLTAVLAYPLNTFPGAAPVIEERQTLARAFSLTPVTIGGAAGALALLGGGAGVLASRRGRDEKYLGVIPGLEPGLGDERRTTRTGLSRDPIAVRFTPPDGMPAGLMGTLVDEKADVVDVTATIVDLAVRGHLRIEEVSKERFFRDGDWKLTRLAPPSGPALLDYEQLLLTSIFESGDDVLLSDLKQHFAADLSKVQDWLYREVMVRGWFRGNPATVRAVWLAAGIAATAAGIALTVALALSTTLALIGVGVAVAGVVLTVLAPRMPARTASGTAALAQALGFRRYLETAEANQIRFEEGQDVFSRYLPYAIVFGVAERWSKVFDDLAASGVALSPPTWYVGQYAAASAFNMASFGGAIDQFSTVAAGSLTAPTPSTSGGSGFGGGGGFSGGGGGGGGGGSW